MYIQQKFDKINNKYKLSLIGYNKNKKLIKTFLNKLYPINALNVKYGNHKFNESPGGSTKIYESFQALGLMNKRVKGLKKKKKLFRVSLNRSPHVNSKSKELFHYVYKKSTSSFSFLIKMNYRA